MIQDYGFGLAALEAMSLGLPCILTDIPAFRENFADAALFVELRNPIALAEAIAKLIGDEKMQIRLSKIGLAVARSFSWETVSKNELEAIEQTLSQSKVHIR